jgi:hypothetical protein
MNGFSPDRRPQQLAQMMAMQERNRSLSAPPGQRDMAMRQVPGLAYGQPTPNAAPGVPPQNMTFNGPQTSPQPGITGRPGMMGGMGRPQGMSPQIGGRPMRPRMPASPGMTTPQGGAYRGDFENAG